MKTLIYSLLSLFILLLTNAQLASGQQSTLAGNLLYHDDWPIAGARVVLMDQNTGLAVDTVITDSAGGYFFSGVNPGSYSFDVSIQTQKGGIDLIDAIMIMQYLNPFGQTMLSPIQRLAADMNEDSQITYSDATAIILYWVYNSLSSYGFGYGQGNGNNSATSSSQEEDLVVYNSDDIDTILMNNDSTQSDTTYVESDGSKRGDVDGAFEPQKKPSPVEYLNSDGRIEAANGEHIIVPFKASGMQEVSGFGLHFSYDSTLMVPIRVIGLPEGAVWAFGHGSIAIAWVNASEIPFMYPEGATVFEVEFLLSENPQPSIGRFRNLDGSHILGSRGTKEFSPILTYPAIHTTNGIANISLPYPNPATEHTQVRIEAENNCSIGYHLRDASGRWVHSCEPVLYSKGQHEVPILLTGLAPGNYTIEFLGETMEGKQFRLIHRVAVGIR